MTLSEQEKTILNRVQSNFPIDSRPFQVIADDLGICEETVLETMHRLREHGVIRRLGGSFSSEKLGFVSTLCAARIPAEKIDDFTKAVNRFPGVTHNYERDNDRYNIWFTIIGPSREDIACCLQQIQLETDVSGILNLPATRVYKIDAHFDL